MIVLSLNSWKTQSKTYLDCSTVINNFEFFSGLPGHEIDQGLVKIEKPSFTSVSAFTEVSLGEMIKTEVKGFHKKRSVVSSKHNMDAIKETDEINEPDDEVVTCDHKNNVSGAKSVETFKKENLSSDNCKENVRNDVNSQGVKEKLISDEPIKPPMDQVVQKISSRPPSKFAMSKRVSKPTTKATNNKPNPPRALDVLQHIKKCLQDWFTMESMIFIHGDKKVKDLLNEKKLSDHFENLQVHSLQRNQQIKYRNICRRLQLQEFADEKFDNAVTGNVLKPVPDYNSLKVESKDMDLKVKSFYSGSLYEASDENFPVKEKTDQDDESEDRFLPLVSRNSQMALRRKVFLNSIEKP